LKGALNAGASEAELAMVFDALTDLIARDDAQRYRQLLQKVVGE
jgi:hypothetical protein